MYEVVLRESNQSRLQQYSKTCRQAKVGKIFIAGIDHHVPFAASKSSVAPCEYYCDLVYLPPSLPVQLQAALAGTSFSIFVYNKIDIYPVTHGAPYRSALICP